MNKSQNPRTENIVFRLTAAEKDFIQQQADNCGLSLSMFCHDVLLGFRPRQRLTSEQVALMGEIRKLRNDLVHINNYNSRHPDWDGIRGDNELLISRLNNLLKKGE